MAQEPPTTPTDQFDPAATDLPSENSRDGARKRRDPGEPAAVVGIGASAGGIAVLQNFFGEMPKDSGLAFVVVMHLSPEHESSLASILQQRTSMPVAQVTDAVTVRPNHVYVIPPNKQLTFEASKLVLLDAQPVGGRRVTIDLFFRTLAQSYGQRSVCIIMSGSDSDGVIGLKHIRAQGGVTMAQDPDEAEHESMPLNAISTGMVDWVLPVGQMPGKLMEFVRNEHRMKLPPEIEDSDGADEKVREAPGGETVSDETRSSDDEAALVDVLSHLRAQTSHDFSHYKRATVLRRIARRMQVNSLESIPEYLEFLRRHPAEASALLADLLIGVTHFFRDRDAFAALEAHLPQLFASKSRDDYVRAWVAGCATGEEAYSLAMLISEQAERMENPPRFQVFASDVDEQAIGEARDALYPAMIEADVSHERLRHFFARDQGRYRVKKELRERVLFAAHDVLKDAPFSRVDLISCRNLLIYLTPKAQNQLFDIFHFSLRPGGLLFIGSAEGGNVTAPLFSPLDAHHRIYVRRAVPRPTWQIPQLPLRAGDPQKAPPVRPRPRRLPALSAEGVESGAETTAQTRFDRQERRAVLFGELHLKLLEEYGPPSVVVNESNNVVHLSTNAGRYMQFVAGEPSANVVALVRPELRMEVRAALFRAAQTGETVKASPVGVDVGGKHEMIEIEVRPIRKSDAEHGYFLIFFASVEAEQKAVQVAPVEHAPSGDITNELENEIQFLKNQLNSTIEQYEATAEELKASNEELQAMNEEMRSTTEELETSKEELQSVNEELITVNNELKSNVEELSRANTDLNNLMASTDIGTIFLDRKSRISRFTPSAVKIFNLLPTDIGRPISDITHRLTYDGFIADAERVHDELQTIEREVRVGENKWYMTRIAPYRTSDDHIAGVVVTFIDITARKLVEEELRASETRLRVLADAIPQIVWTNSSDGTANYFNQRWYAFTGLSYEESRGPGWQAVVHPDDAAMKDRWMNAFHTGEVFEAEYRLRAADGNYRWFISRNVPLKDADGRAISWFGTATDIHDLKEAESALRESEERFRQFGENSADVLWIVDAKTRRPEYVSPAFEKVWGVRVNHMAEAFDRWRELLHPEDRERVLASVEELLQGKTLTREYRIVRPDNGVICWMRDVGFPIRDSGNRIVRIAGIAQDITPERERTERMRAAEERFNLLVEGTPDYAMFLLDRNNVITYWSRGAERVFGWPAEEAVGQLGDIVFTPEDLARNRPKEEIEIALRDGRAPDQRWHVRKDGSRLWIDGVMRRLDDRGFAKVARDATEQHHAQEALRAAHEELEQRVFDRTRELQTMNETLEAEMKRRQELEQEILQVTERERARISQDLHDSLCQELTATAFFLKSSGKNVAKESPAAAETLREAAETVNKNAGLARDLARGMHPLDLGSGGLIAALRELATRTNERVTCRCECPRSLRVPNQAVAANLYRIAQEAVTNALKHSKPSEIVICVERDKSEIVMSVTNDGKSLNERRGKRGMGIHMMHYRANASGGTLTIESKRGGGTKVTCRVPAKQ